MNLESYEAAWRNQAAPTPAELARRARRAHRGRLLILGLATVHTVAATAVALANASFSPLALALPLLALAVLALLIRRQLRLREAWRQSTEAVADALRLTLGEIDEELASHKTLGVYGALAAPLFAVLLYQLHAAGKMNDSAVLSLGLMLAAVYAGNAIRIAYRRGQLLPQRDHLQRVIAQLR
jgi:hypothetical protein